MIGIAIALYSMVIWYKEIILVSLIIGPCYYYYLQNNQLSYESEDKFGNSDNQSED